MPNNTAQMNPSRQFCPNVDCPARGKIGHGNIVVQSKARPRYRCKACGKTFSATQGTMLAGLRKSSEVIVIVITLLAYGCPLQAIVHAYGLDERTIARWRDRAGNHCKQVHHALLEQGQLDLMHVQADEIRVKGRKMIAWMGLALMVSTRLWVAGTVSLSRDRTLADPFTSPGPRLCAERASCVGLHRWLGRLPRQHRAERSVKKSKHQYDGDAPASRCGQSCASPPSSNEHSRSGWLKSPGR